MKPKAAWTDRFQYWLDNQFSRGTRSLIKWLGIISFVFISVMAAIVSLFKVPVNNAEPVPFFEAFWLSLMHYLDAGTMGADVGWWFRIAMFIVTLTGVFIISTLIGILTSGIENRIEELRKGRSRVIEEGHTVILGWSEQVFIIINELVLANENQGDSCIVVMSDLEKVDMEDDIRHKVHDLQNTRVVCRHGSPMDITDLRIVNLNTAKSIIVVSPMSENPDSEVIKTIMAIVNHPDRRDEPYHIVAEIGEPDHVEAAMVVGGNEVEWVLVGDFVSRVIAQTCRQSGLSVVITDLLDFEGDEIYFTRHPDLVGKSFGDAITCFQDNAVMGIKPSNSRAILNPPMGQILTEGDDLIIIAEDDDKINYSPVDQSTIKQGLIVNYQPPPQKPEKMLLLGWNSRCPAIIHELNSYIAPGSEITITALPESIQLEDPDTFSNLENARVKILPGNTTHRSTLENLDLGKYNHVILLSYSDILPPQQADSRTLVTLLHLRDLADKNHYHFSMVTEMMDVRNRDLAAVARADDFIVSDRLVSLVLAQVSENKQINSVYQDLFDPEGAEIYLKPISEYVFPNAPVNFYTLLEAARRKGETAIGYRIQAHARNSAKNYGVSINPPKHREITFAMEDRLIVLANS